MSVRARIIQAGHEAAQSAYRDRTKAPLDEAFSSSAREGLLIAKERCDQFGHYSEFDREDVRQMLSQLLAELSDGTQGAEKKEST